VCLRQTTATGQKALCPRAAAVAPGLCFPDVIAPRSDAHHLRFAGDLDEFGDGIALPDIGLQLDLFPGFLDRYPRLVQDMFGVLIVTIEVGGVAVDHMEQPQRGVAADSLVSRPNRRPDSLFRAVNADDNQ
jgi:hypothetical protein